MSSSKVVFSFVARDTVGLNVYQKSILMHLAAHANVNGECHPGIDVLVLETGMSRSSVLRAIAGLRELGIIRYDRGGSLKRKSNTYFLQVGAMEARKRVSPRHPHVSTGNPTGLPQTPTSVCQTPHQCPPDTPSLQRSVQVSVHTECTGEVPAPFQNGILDLEEPKFPTRPNERTHAESSVAKSVPRPAATAGLPASGAADEFMDVPSDVAWTSWKEQVIH